MKKFYLIIILFNFSLLSFSQSPIATIDRANVVGPTNSGSDAQITSSGLVRGAGVSLATVNNTNFTTNQWQATSQAEAFINNEYIEWSVTSSAFNSIEVTEIDIRNRINANGPLNWQIFYSLDAFTSTNFAVTAVQNSATSATNYNFNGLSIDSGTSGTITFRLYAWNASTNGGWFRISPRNVWSDFGIDRPGIRIWGNITNTATNSIESNIISSTTFIPETNIDYTAHTSNRIKVGEFIIQDGGDDLTDSDNLPTILTDLSFSVSGNNNLSALSIFDGLTNISETSIVESIVNFSGLNLIALDDNSKTFDVYVTFGTLVTDNERIQLTVNSAIADVINGSSFSTFDAGGAFTSESGDDNKISVNASQLVFDQEPSDVNQFEIMTPFPTVLAVDINGNQDLDFSGPVTVLATGPLDPPSIIYNIENGSAVFDSIIFSDQGSNFSLVAVPSGILTAISMPFNVIGPLVQIAIQDFDNTSPEWSYTNDIPFFDNGWGIDGYYGIIDIASGSPLNYPYFKNNILGENDLNDEGDNGTNGWATIQFDDVDISSFSDVQVRFDWQVIGYANNNDNAQYQLFYDGVGQGRVFIFDGDNSSNINDGSGSIALDIPDVVNTISLEIRVRNNGNNGYSGFDNFEIVSLFNGLIYTNNAWIPNPPSESTGLEDAFVRDGNYIVGSNIQLNNMFIREDASVSISPAQSITLNNDLLNAGTLELNSVSTSYSSLIIEGKSTGDVVYNRHTNINQSVGGNDLITAPVTGQTFGDFASENTNLFSNPSNPTEKLFGPFDKVTDTYLTYDTAIPAEANVTLDPAVGYRAATSDGSILKFKGTVNTENIDISIVNSGPTNPEWNLIGNPYPSYLNLAEFLSINSTVFDPASSGIYGYDGDASDGYNIWNQAYSDANPNAKLTPGQGFLIASAEGGADVSFTTTMRTNGTTDDFIPGRIMPIEHLKLELKSDENVFYTDFYFTDNATVGLDPGYDSQIFGGIAPDFAIFSHLISNNNGNDFAIQSINYTDFSNAIIPLGINAEQGEEIIISIMSSSIPETVNIYLEDTINNTSTLLNDNDFTTTPTASLSGTGQFFLRFSESSLSTIENSLSNLEVYATSNPKVLHINGTLNDESKVSIYDLQGREILTSNLKRTNLNNEIDISKIGTGVYVVIISSNSINKSEKIIIR